MEWLMTLIADAGWIAAITALIGPFITYFVMKSNNRKELAISDRMQLSKDQYQLIAELREMMTDQSDEIGILREDMRRLQEVNLNLTLENKELQRSISNLTEENSRLQIKIDKLNKKLESIGSVEGE